MKKSIKPFIFAVVLGSLFTTSNISFANDHITTTDNTLLVRGAENKFADFMNQKAKRFVKKEDWRSFEQIVTLYSVSPSKLLTVDAEAKASFNEAVKNVDRKLGKIKGPEADTWRKKVQVTANVINFLWNNKFNSEQVEPENSDFQMTASQVVGE